MENMNELPNYIEKIELIKMPLLTVLSTIQIISPLSKIVLIEYNSNVYVTSGTISDIIEKVKNLQICGSTNFKKLTECVKNEIIKVDPEYSIFKFILTDGKHTEGGLVCDLINDQTNKGLFDITLGIGDETNVGCDLLKHLSNNIEDAYCVTTNPTIIEDTINGGCFEGLISLNIKQANIDIIFDAEENKNNMYVFGEKNRKFIDQFELDDLLKNNTDTNQKIICDEIYDNHYIIKSKEDLDLITVNNQLKNNKIQFIIAIDTSGSMGSCVRLKKYENFGTEQKNNIFIPEEEINTIQPKKYIKLSLNEIANFTHNNNLLIRGKPLYAIIKYNYKNYNKSELIEISHIKKNNQLTEFNKKIIDYVNIISEIERIDKIKKSIENLNIIKNNIIMLYNDNLGFVNDIDNKIKENWLIHYCKTLWEQLTLRYKNVLSTGEKFIYFNKVTPSLLCRTVSSNISSQSSSIVPFNTSTSLSRLANDDTFKCKICLTNDIKMVFTKCHHAGTCTDCVKSFIDTNNNLIDFKCPFCKSEVNNYVQINTVTIKPFCQLCKKVVVSYFGKCGHPICCKKCIMSLKNEVTNLVHCNICNSDVTVMKVFMS